MSHADPARLLGIRGKSVSGGKVLRPLKDQFYGDRSGTVQDPFGHVWHLSTHKEELSLAEIKRRGAEAMKEMG